MPFDITALIQTKVSVLITISGFSFINAKATQWGKGAIMAHHFVNNFDLTHENSQGTLEFCRTFEDLFVDWLKVWNGEFCCLGMTRL